MEQYVSKAALVTEIERMKVNAIQFPFEEYGTVGTCNKLLSFLDTLEMKDANESLRTEYEKGRADVLRCIDPDVMVADFCSQPLSKTRSIASVYRQGIIDILKRINRNEETSITGTRSIDDVGL